MKKGVVFLILVLCVPLRCLGAGGGVVISQVQVTAGEGKTDQDFVELFNSGDQAFNLKGYRLVKRGKTSNKDSSVKVWSRETIIPAKSFYLWANTHYAFAGSSPDSTTSATISEDNGVGLRKGGLDSGDLIDSISWGKADNTFVKALPFNPGAGQAIWRTDLYNSNSSYSISTSRPHNSTVTDLIAGFMAAQASSAAPRAAKPTVAGVKTSPVIASSEVLETKPVAMLEEEKITKDPLSDEFSQERVENPKPRNTPAGPGIKGIKYLILAFFALLGFIGLLMYLAKKQKT